MLLPGLDGDTIRVAKPEYLINCTVEMSNQSVAKHVCLPAAVLLIFYGAFLAPGDVELGMIRELDDPPPFGLRGILDEPPDGRDLLPGVLPPR